MSHSLKPFKNIDDQISLLKSRNMQFPDEERAKRLLAEIGYYRLSQYSYKFRDSNPDNFLDGTTFDDIVKLYRFDEQLRVLLYSALGKIEIYFRAKLGYYLGEKANNAHDISEFFPQIINKKTYTITYEDWYGTIQERFSRACTSGNPVALHHKKNYDSKLPIWVFVDFFDFKDLSQMFALMAREDQHQIAKSLGLSSSFQGFGVVPPDRLPKTSLVGWLERLTVARNICAHHARLWDTTHIHPVDIKDGRKKRYFSDISTKSNSINGVYGVITIALFLLAAIGECEYCWAGRFKDLILKNFNPDSRISEKYMKFPDRDTWLNTHPWNIPDHTQNCQPV